MPEPLNDVEVRILGALVEKQLTTPEYYPLTLNSLVTACNQKNNRDPVVAYDDKTVTDALDRLRDRNLVYVFYGSTSRVPKYKHMLPSIYELDPAETAVMSVLMLRGPQTAGEIRGRSERLFDFRDLGEVQETLDRLARRDEPLITKLERLAGHKEARYAHLLSGPIDMETVAATVAAPRVQVTAGNERLDQLEREVQRLSTELAEFKAMFEQFRKQFD
jgi:uncharacterized protein